MMNHLNYIGSLCFATAGMYIFCCFKLSWFVLLDLPILNFNCTCQ